MRGLVAGLLLGLALGYGLASVRTAEHSPRRSARGGDAEPDRRDTADSTGSATASPPESIREESATDPEPPDGIPPGSLGTLVLRADGTEIQVSRARVVGDVDFEDWNDPDATQWEFTRFAALPSEQDDTLARYSLWPGRYRLLWTGRERTRRSTFIEVRAGETTSVSLNALDQSKVDPIPPDRARLVVIAYRLDDRTSIDSWGLELLVNVGNLGGFTSRPFDLAAGGTSLLLPPTQVQVEFADRTQRANLDAGRETRIEFRYAGEGELLFEGGIEEWPELRRAGESGSRYGVRFRDSQSELFHTAGIAYVPPGEYEVWSGDHDEARLLGRVRIEAGRTTTFRPDLPAGGLEVLVFGGKHECEAVVVLSPEVAQPGQPKAFTREITLDSEDFIDATFEHLPPGRWRLRVTAPDYVTHESVITIGEDVIEHEITLRPQ